MNKLKPIHIALIAFAAFLAVNLSLQQGGFLLYGEADWFLIDHNNPERSFLSKIICPHKHDAEHYMARELAHLVEHIDARFIHWCVMAGHPHFLSISNYICVLLICIIGAKSLYRFTTSNWFILGALLVLLSSPPIITSGNYIRSGHMLATMLMVTLAAYLSRKTLFDTPSWREALVVFGLSLLLVWSDRQGLVAAVAIAVIVAVTRRDCWKTVCIPIISAIAAHTLHYLYLGPKLIAAFTPFGYVKTPANIIAVSGADAGKGFIESFVGNILTNGLVGMKIANSNIGYLLGGVPLIFSLAVIATVAYRAYQLNKEGRHLNEHAAFFITLFAIAGMNAIIYGAAKVLIWPDVAPIIYYNIIGTVAIWMTLLMVFLTFWWQHTPLRLSLLFVITLSNLHLSFGYVGNFKSGHLGGFIAGSKVMREALRQTVNAPQGNNIFKYDANASAHYTDWQWVMKNPLEYGGRLSAVDFVESSQYLQFVRSEKGLPFGKGGRQ